MSPRKNYQPLLLLLLIALAACQSTENKEEQMGKKVLANATVYTTSAAGQKLAEQTDFPELVANVSLRLQPEETHQTITGIGGSFTEASAYLLNQLSQGNRDKIIQAYFSDEGARYSLTRTHINSCDFSLSNYAYVEDNDIELKTFSVAPDEDDIIPMIKDAIAASSDGFKIIASPWSAPPWMKTNNDWRGGSLKAEYQETWANYFAKYLAAYQAQGIEIWGITVENEPLGNASNWESMHFSAEEMTAFVGNHLGPTLAKDWPQIKILGFDQNRDEVKHWVDVMYQDSVAAQYFGGTAVHWYASTYEVFPEALQYAHAASPDKHLIQSEGCIDAEVPAWQNDEWYWSKEATDWGWDWASDETKYLHPKYVPVYRYARDLIGCLNNQVDGWVDWNMVLNRQGGPNWFENWCAAPVIVDEEADEVYFTPLYYTMAHFSKFIRPGGQRIGFELSDDSLQATAAKNPDGSIAVVLLNQETSPKSIELHLGEETKTFSIGGQSIQTVLIPGVEVDVEMSTETK